MKKAFIILVSIAIMVFGSVSLFGYGRGYGRGYGMGCNYCVGYGRYNDGYKYNRYNGYNGCYYYNNSYVK